jgi:HSP20 family protein
MNTLKNRNDVYGLIPRSFNEMLDSLFQEGNFKSGNNAMFVPHVDISEEAGKFNLHISAPGMSKSDFKVDLNDNVLTISGERKFENKEEGKKYLVIETKYGAFSRSFRLPENVDILNISAEYKDGILDISIPKKELKENTKTIEVK